MQRIREKNGKETQKNLTPPLTRSDEVVERVYDAERKLLGQSKQVVRKWRGRARERERRS